MNHLLALYTLAILAIAATLNSCHQNKKSNMDSFDLYIGTYTDGESEGIYRSRFNAASGHLSEPELVAHIKNPSFIKVLPSLSVLYAVQETDDFDSVGGAISVFQIEMDSLKLLDSKGSQGAHPCHIGLDENNHFLAVSNYSGGNFSIFQLNNEGLFTDNFQLFDHDSFDTSRKSHAHAAHFINDRLLVADLGHDALYQYELKNKAFTKHSQSKLELENGSGPRHFVNNQDKKNLYVINELNSTITMFALDDKGIFNEIQTLSTLDDNFDGDSYCADIHLSSDGKYLYGSNRGENTIVIFELLEKGKLSLIGREYVHGDWPRNFTLDPSEKFLLVANQKSNNISVFSRNPDTGEITFMNEIKMSKPVCLEFLN